MEEFGRQDLVIREHQTSASIDRTLDTIHREKLIQIWNQAGYESIPTIREMMHEYADWAHAEMEL